MTCDCCGTKGLYRFDCNRCRARHYVRMLLPREQGVMAKVWRETLPPEQLAELRRLVEEERAREP